MDAATPRLLEAGIVATIGKGARSDAVVEACRRTGSVYFAAVGGTAALLARHVAAAEPVAWEDLGTEALQRLVLDGFPAIVAIDAQGGELYRTAAASWRKEGAL
jgi:tartrate dehydratase beta subunit/fumarate hydratase class I family protein